MNRQNKEQPITTGGAAIMDIPKYADERPEGWRAFDPGTVYCALAVVERDEDGSLFSYSPSLPGAASQGDTAEEALENLIDALVGCITSYRGEGEKIPWAEHPQTPTEAVIAKWTDVNV